MTKAFISYHHGNDQDYKNHLSSLADSYGCFQDGSVQTDDINDDDRSSESIRQLIRDEYLRDTAVTILLCGTDTKHRKHIDWEIKSSMIDGPVNKRSGILVIDLPSTQSNSWYWAHSEEKLVIYPEMTTGGFTIETKAGYRQLFSELPERIIDNMAAPNVSISIVPWMKVENNPDNLRWLIDASAQSGVTNQYDLSRSMRRKNYNP